MTEREVETVERKDEIDMRPNNVRSDRKIKWELTEFSTSTAAN